MLPSAGWRKKPAPSLFRDSAHDQIGALAGMRFEKEITAKKLTVLSETRESD